MLLWMPGTGTTPKHSRPSSQRMPTSPIGGGMGATGRSRIEEFHAPLFATIFKNSHQTFTDIKIRPVRADVAAVDVHWDLTGATDPQGNPRPLRQGLLSFVMAKNDGKWQIVVMHNLDLTALPPPAK
jgi:uncharacterized protein (TIGR02246 family)